jgi:hypothetical protein
MPLLEEIHRDERQLTVGPKLCPAPLLVATEYQLLAWAGNGRPPHGLCRALPPATNAAHGSITSRW